MSTTFLMPNRERKYGISRIQSVSLTWEREIRMLACWTPKVDWYSGMLPKLVIKGLAYPLEIWRQNPKSIANAKNTAIRGFKNKRKAFKPSASKRVLCSPFLRGIRGIVREYAAITRLRQPLTIHWPEFDCNPQRSTIHMVTMKPIVPQTRMGGKAFTVSSPSFSNAE